MSSPARTSVRGSPLTIVFESARSFSLNVSRAASTTARKRVEAGLGRLDVERDPCDAGDQLDRLRLRPASPSANRRTVAVWATVERTSATTGTDSPSRAVDGVVSRSMRTSSTSPRPIRRVSIRTPRDAARAASAWPSPVVSLPSDSRTIRFCASSGKSAVASRRAAPMSVADVTGADASRSISVELGREALDQCALAERDDPRHVAVGAFLERLAQEREGVLAPGVADRIGQVDDEDRRQPVDRQDQLEPGQGEDERRQQQRPDDEGRPAAGPSPSAAARRGGARPSAAAPGPAGAARAARRTRCPSGAPVRGVPPEPRAEPAAHAGSARRGGRRPTRRTAPTRTSSTIGTHSSSRAVGRAVAGGPRRSRVPGDAEAPARRPRASIAAAEPGAIVDSSTSNRSTAKRTGAFGSTGGADGAAEPGRCRSASGAAVGADRTLPDGAGRRRRRRGAA